MSIYKNLQQNDQVTTKTLLHESIPVTSSIISGTYGTYPSESNIKYFSNHDHIDVYDYPHASSSANFIFSITAGQDPGFTTNPSLVQKELKNNIYRQFAQQYVGYDTNQNFVSFNASGVLNPADTYPPKFDNVVFLNFSRVLMKDSIKKGSFSISIGTASFANPHAGKKTFSDSHVTASDPSTYKTNSPMGDYGFLTQGDTAVPVGTEHGIVYYDAGLVVLAANTQTFGTEFLSGSSTSGTFPVTTAKTAANAFRSSSIEDLANATRAHIDNIQFNNTTELNSTVYFCRANNNEFNYSSNPSYTTSGSKIAVKNEALDPPVAYVTSVGLYSPDNQLLAVGKLSEPLKKTPSNEFTLRMRLDY